jgi:pseudouridine-5'-phosphate glycosidase
MMATTPTHPLFDFHPDVAEALRVRRPVVALESTLIAHGLPAPLNRTVALTAEERVRSAGAVPATIAVLDGRPTIGLDAEQIARLAGRSGVLKASRRDLAGVISQRGTAATTVSATMLLAHQAGIRVFATGGIGGVHRGSGHDVSADLLELGRTPVLVVCAGAKSILDLPATLEVLETHGVPVVGYQTDEFPAFYLPSSGLPVSACVESPAQAAALARAHWLLGGAGVVLARPVPREAALDPGLWHSAFQEAERRRLASGVQGPAITPWLLSQLAELTGGASLRANQALIEANALLAAQVACALHAEE